MLCNAFFDQANLTGDDAWIPRYTDALCDQLLKFVQSLLPATQTGSPCFTTLDRHARRSHDRRWTRRRNRIQSSTTSSLRGLVQAPLWGLGKVVALEEPRLGTTLVDLPASMSSISLEIEALIAELRENDGEEQIALRIVADKSESNGSVGHVERRKDSACSRSLLPIAHSRTCQRFQLCGDGAYLVTGGLGALGLACARFLVEEGARYLVLNSRRGAYTAEQGRVLDDLAASGARVEILEAGC